MWCIDAMLSLESTSFSPFLVMKTVGNFEMVAVLDQGASFTILIVDFDLTKPIRP